MNLFKSIFLTTCLLVSSPQLVHSATMPTKLSVQAAIHIALESNLTLKQSEYARLDSLSNYRKVNILDTYTMQAETNVSHNPGSSSTVGDVVSTYSYLTPYGTSTQLTLSPFGVGDSRASMGISITRPLMRGSGIRAEKYNQLLTAKSSVLIQDKVLQNTQRSTILGVISAYYQAVLADAQVDIQQNAVKSAEDSAEFLRKKVDAGFEAGIGLTQADVAVMQAKESLNDARLSARSDMDALMLSMGIGVGQVPQLVDDVPDYNPPLPDLDEAIHTALTNRVEVLQLNESIAQQKRSYGIAKDQLRSDLGLNASWNSTLLNSGFIGSPLLDRGATFVGMKLSVPIDKRALREDRDSSARALDLLEKQYDFQNEQLADNVRNAYHSVEKARASVANLSENEKVISLQVYQAKRRLEEGLGTSYDLVKAQNDQASFNVQLKSAKVNLYLTQLQLRLAMGEDVIMVEPK